MSKEYPAELMPAPRKKLGAWAPFPALSDLGRPWVALGPWTPTGVHLARKKRFRFKKGPNRGEFKTPPELVALGMFERPCARCGAVFGALCSLPALSICRPGDPLPGPLTVVRCQSCRGKMRRQRDRLTAGLTGEERRRKLAALRVARYRARLKAKGG